MDNEKKEKKVNSTSKKGSTKTTQKKGNNTKKTTSTKTKSATKSTNTKKASTNTNAKKSTTSTAKKDTKTTKNKVNETKKNSVKKVDSAAKKEKETEKKVVEEKLEEVKDTEVKSENKKDLVKEVENDEQNNKTILVVLLAILVIIVGVCIYYQIDDKNKNKDTEVSETESSEIMDKFYEYFNSKDLKIIYYASSTCGYCELETPIMEQIDKDYDIDYLYIDSTKLTSSDREKMLKELNIEHATPTTVVVKNGKIIDTNIGYVDGGEMVKFLINAGILKDDAIYTPEQYLTFIDYSEYENIIASEGKSIITIGQTGCSHCIATKPVLNKIAGDYNLTINYLNLTDMTEDEQNSLIDSLSTIEYNEEEFVASGAFGTPLTLIIENGKVISYVNGETTPSNFIRTFKKVGLISK